MSNLRCIASTPNTNPNLHASKSDNSRAAAKHEHNFYKEAQWSPDGTCLITNSADNSIRTFVVPADLLNEERQPHNITPYSTIGSPEPVKAYTSYPGYCLADPSTTLILSSQRDHPIRLNNALDGSKVASYPLVNPTTEAFISPHSLTFSRRGSNFVAGSDSLISVFDVSRVGDAPISFLSTSPKRQSDMMGLKGIISALDIYEASGVLAAGTFSRCVGLYENSGQGGCVGVFSVRGSDADRHIGGAGITQVKWSLDGRYLYIAERKSDGVMFYDIRKTGQLLGWLEGRNAMTNQRLGVEIFNSQDGTTVWAGGVDGRIRLWENPHEHEGPVAYTDEWYGHGDVVSSVASHKTGTVLATCSGQRRMENRAVDSALKVWYRI